jgi:sugar phosphate permease
MADAAPVRDPLVARIPFFYGWIMMPVAMVIQICTSPGQTYGVSVFNPHLREALGLSHSALSGAYMLGTLLAALPMTYVGHLMDRHGPRRTLTGVVLLFGLACIGMSQVSGLITVFLAFLFLRMLGQGSMSMLAANSLALWFNRRLGSVSGLMSVGMAVALGGIPALNVWMIARYGWRWSYVILGVAVWALLLPLLGLVYRSRPEDVGEVPDGRRAVAQRASRNLERDAAPEPRFTLPQALRTRAYWIVASVSAFWSMSITGVHFHSVQIFLDKGLTESDAAAMFTVFAGALALMRFTGGMLADRAPLNLLLAASMLGVAGGFVLMARLSSPMSAHLFAAVLGGSAGIHTAVLATIWVRYFGRAHLGKIVGSMTTVGVAASSVGPLGMAGTDAPVKN